MNDTSSIKVWDIGVRLFHWALVAFFVLAYLSGEGGEEGGSGEALHVWSGYAILALLVFRVVWGIVGPKHARFADFIYGPGAVMGYIKGLFTGSPKRYIGHNPAGGVMVLLMLVALCAVSWTGLKAYQAEGKGPLAAAPALSIGMPVAKADDGGEREESARGGEEFWEEAHETSVNVMLILIVLHLAGVTVSSLMHRENLPVAMITGRKRG